MGQRGFSFGNFFGFWILLWGVEGIWIDLSLALSSRDPSGSISYTKAARSTSDAPQSLYPTGHNLDKTSLQTPPHPKLYLGSLSGHSPSHR